MSTFTSFAIAGAGLIGSIITDVLLSNGLNVTILTRDDSKASLQTFKERGAVIAKVDYDDENSLSSALSDVQVVVSTLSAYQIALQVGIARAAKAAGVELFVPGEYGVPTEVLFPKKMIRDLLREIDLPSTIFYCGIFSEYLAPYLDFNFAEGTIRVVGSGEAKFSMTSIPDVGRFAGHVLATATKSDLKWATIPFEGDRLSPLEIAALAEKKLGKKMQLEFADYAENKKNFNTEHKAMYTTLIEEGLAVTGTEEEVKSAIAKFYPDWNPTPYESFIGRDLTVEKYGALQTAWNNALWLCWGLTDVSAELGVVLMLRTDPQLGQVERNMEHVDKMVASLSKEDRIDVLMLSEMAFTGYVFKSKAEVAQVAEVAGQGPTFDWCQCHARRLRCMVTCGYVERDEELLYNSMMVVSPDGELVCNPRKTFLYETDKSWATPGDGFCTWHCPWLDKTISFGICMDINPDDFKAPFTAYEFGSHALAQKSDLILFACAWNDFEAQDLEPYATLSYWAQRLSPVIDALAKGEYTRPNCHFLCSNRTGTENGTFFVGASCVLSLKEPAVVAHAGRRTEALLRVEIPDAVEQE